jgi:glycosyltransferase involved in cell wall biosynthesis
MKVVAIIENTIVAGGGFNQSLNAILQMQDICKGRFEFEVLTTCHENVSCLAQLGAAARHVKISFIDKLLVHWALSPAWRTVQRRTKYTGPFERRLLRMGCDLAYFVSPTPSPIMLQRLNFIATVWDLCHRDFPEFPEVRSFGEIQARERMLHATLPGAYAVIGDSDELVDAMGRLYGIDRHRMISMPFSPSPLMHKEMLADPAQVLCKHGLRQGYFYYPAQFWAHKNHNRIIQATAILRQQGIRIDVAFAGGDAGELQRLKEKVKRLNLAEQIRFLGFVPNEDMRSLYEGCRALIMPTYFGPTNIPPLEAWSAKRPLIYSSHLAAQVGDAALLVDPDDAESLAAGMRQCLDDEVVANLVARGTRRLEEIETTRRKAESLLLEALERFARRMQAWA